jgi:4-hydroxy-tetrahydrodipicolinate reductase
MHIGDNQESALIINGAGGRMGRRIIALSRETGAFQLVGAVDYPQHPDLGKDAGVLAGIETLGVPLTAKLQGKADVVIDFSLPQAADATMDFCEKNGISLVLGTTGLSKEQLARLSVVAAKIPVVQATNMSLGMNLLFALVGKVAKALGPEYDVEIVEAHHRFKKDAPSGSALSLAESVCRETGRSYPDCLTYGREERSPCAKRAPSVFMPSGQAISSVSTLSSTVPSARPSPSNTTPTPATPSSTAPFALPSGWLSKNRAFIKCSMFWV